MSEITVKAWGGEINAPLQPVEYTLDEPGVSDVDIRVEYCGVCHSDLSVLTGSFGELPGPVVGGHEAVGRVVRVCSQVKNLEVGQLVGVGWTAGSCMQCHSCMSGDQQICATAQPTIIGRHGGFADHLRASAEWVIPIPDGVDAEKAGPLFCGGITVFNPLLEFDVKPTDKVGVIGIGGLGHLAIQFLDAWGCHVTAFSTSDSKEDEAKGMGADDFVNITDDAVLKAIRNQYDFIISTINVDLNWNRFIAALKHKGRLHTLGLTPGHFGPSTGQALIPGQKSVSGSPTGSPARISTMLDFCARHNIEAVTETLPLTEVNTALKRLEAGDVRYRFVLDCR